jgi:hypothetical protein
VAEGKIGYVYIISNEYDQIKIGVSVNPVKSAFLCVIRESFCFSLICWG